MMTAEQLSRLVRLVATLSEDDIDSVLEQSLGPKSEAKKLRHLAKDAPLLDQIKEALSTLDNRNQLAAFCDVLTMEYPAFNGEIVEIQNFTPGTVVTKFWRPETDPLPHLHWFDRDAESSVLYTAMEKIKREPYSERPILVVVTARRDDEYAFSIRRFNLEAMSGVFGVETLASDPKGALWDPGGRPEYYFRRFAYRQIKHKSEQELKSLDIKRLIEELAKGMDGRTFTVDVAAERIDSQASQDLKDYLDLWAQLGQRAAPLVVYIVIIADSDKPGADERLVSARDHISKTLDGVKDKFVVVEPIGLGVCWPEHIKRWCDHITDLVGEKTAQEAGRYLEDVARQTNFRFRDVVTSLKKAKGDT